MSEKVTLSVNGHEVRVAAGANLIDALEAVGIDIPHFCYHPALGADGNCRMCLVEIEDGRPPIVPACKTPAAEGMKVVLESEKIKKIQRDILEMELINHPVDCPVCDQAGECTLQDYYMKFDLGDSRMDVAQVKKDKRLDFGGGVVHDQERCVLCGRCVRFTRQITKTGELGIVNRADQARVAIFPGKPLNNRYALNVVELCPVGAMTSRDFRFKQRVWFLKKTPGVCHGCATGCSITIDHHREKYKDARIYRYRARHNPLINGYFICDDGRLSYHLENENRLETPLVKGVPVTPTEALDAVRTHLGQAKYPLVVVSPDCSLEQLYAAQMFCLEHGAKVSGYSAAAIVAGDGDDYLIKDDKAANRPSLNLLGIDTSREYLREALGHADLVITLNNDPFTDGADADLSEMMKGITTIACATHHCEFFDNADIVLPIASYSEYAGSVINSDGVLQRFGRAVVKNRPVPELLELLHALGGPVADMGAAWAGMRTAVAPLGAVDPDKIGEHGMRLEGL
ncbi:MAG: (2Fe-2S)-binding protein [Desulfofustis sp. PB-SRB1]|jgi:NADH-quinone oxidoreductase subunit G|nr:(2Fe-2S)-binding protein [Desulfofustis sp. PB-SRB1]